MEPNRQHTVDPRWRSALAGGGLAVVLFVVLAGCTPKRVVQGQVVTSPSAPPPATTKPDTAGAGGATVTPTPEPVAGLDLPKPKPRGRSGAAPVRRTAAEVGFGIKAANLAREQLGKPYQWGATGPDKFDCSGLVWHVYGQLGVQVPRVSREQARAGNEVNRSELQPGDLVFFATEGRSVNHVGIYVGDSDFVHAPRRYVPVKTDSLNNSWWRRRYRGARRVP